MDISKLTLGTAQLGFNYGVNNLQGQPTEKESHEILKYAFVNGINTIDTSPNYGNSERIIGQFIKQNKLWERFLITKLDAQEFPDELWDDESTLYRRTATELWSSCIRLGSVKVSAYILHFVDQAFKNNGMILDVLTELKKRHYVEFIGTSLYTTAELERCIDDKRIEVVQLPFSILDRRLLESGLLKKASERDLVIFARSVFLQGLVFMDRLPVKLWSAREVIRKLYRLAYICHMSVNELCLRYVLSINEISSVVIGVDSLKQLKENIKVASLGPLDKDILKEIERLSQMPADLIDIRSWGQRFDFSKGE